MLRQSELLIHEFSWHRLGQKLPRRMALHDHSLKVERGRSSRITACPILPPADRWHVLNATLCEDSNMVRQIAVHALH
ncbi:MAG: hypothetical protein WA993_18450 [Candidatus Binatus sp.]|jgi:hypothetical protein